jgi:hypothetical protein
MTRRTFVTLLYAPLALLVMPAIAAVGVQHTFDEFGRPVEMRGLVRIYLDVGDDIDLRERVIRTIDKSIAPAKIQWVSKAPDAELCLAYVTWQEREGDDTFGKLFAFSVTPEGPSRLVWSAKDRKMSIAVFTPDTSTILAKRFAAAYKEAQK